MGEAGIKKSVWEGGMTFPRACLALVLSQRRRTSAGIRVRAAGGESPTPARLGLWGTPENPIETMSLEERPERYSCDLGRIGLHCEPQAPDVAEDQQGRVVGKHFAEVGEAMGLGRCGARAAECFAQTSLDLFRL